MSILNFLKNTLISWGLIGFILGLVLTWPTPAEAHQLGLSRGTYRAQDRQLDAEIIFQNSELTSTISRSDTRKNGELDPQGIKGALVQINDVIVQNLWVHGDGHSCPGVLTSAQLVEGDGIELHAQFTCPIAPQKWSIELAYLAQLSPNHHQLSLLEVGKKYVDKITSMADPKLDFPQDVSAGVPRQSSPSVRWESLFLLGVDHILTGYDHLLFLLGLLLVGGRFRSLVGVITAFTLAHSITLALAVFRIWSPEARFVEPAIALSITYVGIENFFVTNAEGRWRITFPFGLLHGFGFAGALAEIQLPPPRLPMALLLFNWGVEVGQLMVMLPTLGLLLVLRKRPWFPRYGIRGLSVLIIAAGIFWFFQRIYTP